MINKISLILGIFSVLVTPLQVNAADRIFLTYGPFKFTLRVESLETFAETGEINNNLNFLLRTSSPEELAEIRRVLTQSHSLNPVYLSRFFNSDIGEDILERMGRLITIHGGSNGKHALRGALIQAALEPEGFTVINFLKKLPVNMQLQGEGILNLTAEINRVIRATEIFIAEMERMTAQEATQEWISDSNLPDLRLSGEYDFVQETWRLKDESREREFSVDVYIPQRSQREKIPVVIISHGLSSRPQDFAERAKHLASYGFLVAVPQHIGSDLQHTQAFLRGFYRQLFDLNEFINRPLDISYVIDELERRNNSTFGGQLNLESVGVYGHSFGGYAALALAGAEIDFENLEQNCQQPFSALNTSLLLQCRALDLPRKVYNFRDSRVKAVIASNPVNSGIFGPVGLSKIDIPVLLGAGSHDPATPVVFEQARSFIWLTSPNKYLVMAQGQAHVDFSQIDEATNNLIQSLENLTLPSPDLLHSYANAVSVAFFEVHLNNNQNFLPFLTASYAEYISDEQFPLNFISSSSRDELEAAFNRFRRENRRRSN